jgi:putative methionine-R-sulfoxide reductase with GAF domain
MQGLAQPEDRFPSSNSEDMNAATNRSPDAGAADDKSKRNRALEEAELDSALQLLVERAQYITGATGTALALPQGNEMVCRASAGSSAPAVGARLQVLSGLTGESISRRQLLRCDNAETDPRVNLEACRALGIASIVVLPLFRHNGEVRGLIELFSDHPYAFEERDLIALERMADLTLTALDLAEQQNAATLSAPRRAEPGKPGEPPSRGSGALPRLEGAEPRPHTSAAAASPAISPQSPPAGVPEAMRLLQKCASCGFPISEGRTVCLDCEKKSTGRKEFTKKPLEMERVEVKKPEAVTQTSSMASKAEEFVPAFLVNASSVQKSWMSNPVNVLAIIVVIVGILVAVVVFR